MPHERLVRQTEVPAFSCGSDTVISAWNQAAERTFAVPAREVVGRECHQVLCGQDVFGNQFCSRLCICRQMAMSGQSIRPFRLRVRDRLDRRFVVQVTVLVVQGDSEKPQLVHLLEPFPDHDLTCFASHAGGNLSKLSQVGSEFLTSRELEVLGCLALGLGTSDIARRLEISAATVRNHVASCLRKLDAHSRLEAVAVANRLDLV